MTRFSIFFLLAAGVLGAQNAPVRQQPQPQQGQAQPPDVPADCVASGTVVNVLTGQKLIRASVLVNSAGGNGLAGASTDADGNWSISGVRCEAITFAAEKDGFIANTYGHPPTSPANAPSVARPVTLVSGTPAKDLKIEMMPEAVISGKVLDELGEPAAGAQVRIMRSVVQTGKRTVQYEGLTNTDNTGSYRIGGVMAGRFFICANYSRVRYPVGGGSPTAYGESCYPGPVSRGASGTMKVEGGKEVRKDFTLSRITGVHVRGTISGISAPASFVMVQIIRTESNGMMLGGQIRPQQARNGKFEFLNVTPGSYQLRANNAGGGDMLSAATPIDVGSTDLDGVSLNFQPGAVVSGTVKIESSDATPVPAADPASPRPVILPGLNISMVPLGMGPMGRVQWDKDHTTFSFAEVQPGKYRLNLSATGAGYFVKSVRLNDKEIQDRELTVTGTTGPVEVVISNVSGTLQGTVADADGKPAESITILICGDRPAVTGRTRIDGVVRMQNIPVGQCQAWAFDSGDAEYADEEWMRRNAGIGAAVSIASGATAQVSLVRRVVPQ